MWVRRYDQEKIYFTDDEGYTLLLDLSSCSCEKKCEGKNGKWCVYLSSSRGRVVFISKHLVDNVFRR